MSKNKSMSVRILNRHAMLIAVPVLIGACLSEAGVGVVSRESQADAPLCERIMTRPNVGDHWAWPSSVDSLGVVVWDFGDSVPNLIAYGFDTTVVPPNLVFEKYVAPSDPESFLDAVQHAASTEPPNVVIGQEPAPGPGPRGIAVHASLQLVSTMQNSQRFKEMFFSQRTVATSNWAWQPGMTRLGVVVWNVGDSESTLVIYGFDATTAPPRLVFEKYVRPTEENAVFTALRAGTAGFEPENVWATPQAVVIGNDPPKGPGPKGLALGVSLDLVSNMQSSVGLTNRLSSGPKRYLAVASPAAL